MCEEKEYIGVTVDIIISVEEFTFMIFIKKNYFKYFNYLIFIKIVSS